MVYHQLRNMALSKKNTKHTVVFALMTDELHPVHLYHTHTAAEDQLPGHREERIKSILVSVSPFNITTIFLSCFF